VLARSDPPGGGAHLLAMCRLPFRGGQKQPSATSPRWFGTGQRRRGFDPSSPTPRVPLAVCCWPAPKTALTPVPPRLALWPPDYPYRTPSSPSFSRLVGNIQSAGERRLPPGPGPNCGHDDRDLASCDAIRGRHAETEPVASDRILPDAPRNDNSILRTDAGLPKKLTRARRAMAGFGANYQSRRWLGRRSAIGLGGPRRQRSGGSFLTSMPLAFFASV